MGITWSDLVPLSWSHQNQSPNMKEDCTRLSISWGRGETRTERARPLNLRSICSWVSFGISGETLVSFCSWSWKFEGQSINWNKTLGCRDSPTYRNTVESSVFKPPCTRKRIFFPSLFLVRNNNCAYLWDSMWCFDLCMYYKKVKSW